MLRWELHHPVTGHLVLERGADAEFLEIDPGWPRQNPGQKSRHTFNESPPGARLHERIAERLSRPKQRVRVLVNGEVMGRYDHTPASLGLAQNIKEGEFSQARAVPPTEPQLKLTKNFLDELLLVAYHDRATQDYVELDPPVGSRSAAYRESLEESPYLRFTLPLLFGLGKSAWFLAMLVLMPLLGRVAQWLLALLPEVEAPRIALPVPDIRVHLPAPPQISLPVPSWQIPWPAITPPDWLLFLMDYSKAWLPLVIGVGAAVLAVRNGKKSKRRRAELEDTPR
ncbi:hypothetical protein [Rothia nasimurium]|uniref:hypothetical protein n=1 Tax=Rothia nasimurium TaxID=85336 RepID=UPI001F2A94D1|nr:hypothetical protein [Rothia nasimurium]